MYAIVDIETTGGYAAQNCITEIAIILFNGIEEEGRYHTLVNPQIPIQKYVQSMTGITDEMVANAPKFEEIARNIFNLLSNKIFVAHNVNFDYSFIKSHLKTAGYEIDLPKICTVKLSRKIFPGLMRYGLGKLCKHFSINNSARHRSMGDTEALKEIFILLLKNDVEGIITKSSKKRNSFQYLPPNVNSNILENIPSLPGVYYFHNNKRKIIYVGKAICLKKRVSSHFSNNKSSQQKQDFLKEIYNITWQDCSSDFIASIFESIEIKRLWPQFNKSQKQFDRQYGIFLFEDANGYKRLAIDFNKKIIKPLLTFSLLLEARQTLFKLCNEFDIHPSLFFLSKETTTELPTTNHHNKKVEEILLHIQQQNTTYLIHDGALNYVLVENGKFYGIGKFESIITETSLDQIKPQITTFPENLVVQSYVKNYIHKYPDSIVMLK